MKNTDETDYLSVAYQVRNQKCEALQNVNLYKAFNYENSFNEIKNSMMSNDNLLK